MRSRTVEISLPFPLGTLFNLFGIDPDGMVSPSANGHADRCAGESCPQTCDNSAAEEAGPARDDGRGPLSVGLRDLASYSEEILDQVVIEQRPVVLYSASRRDPLNHNGLPPETGRPVAIVLPIEQYRELVQSREEKAQALRNIADFAARA